MRRAGGIGLRAQRFVEIAGRAVPVEDGPFESAAAAFECNPRQVPQQRLAYAEAAKRGPHEQVLEVQAVLAEKRREIVKVQRESGAIAADPGDQRLGCGPRPKQCVPQVRLRGHHLVGKVLVVGQLFDEPQNQRQVRLLRRRDRNGSGFLHRAPHGLRWAEYYMEYGCGAPILNMR